MAYTRPAYNDADASWVGASTYTRPAYNEADASFVETPVGDGPFFNTNSTAAFTTGQVLSSLVSYETESAFAITKLLSILKSFSFSTLAEFFYYNTDVVINETFSTNSSLSLIRELDLFKSQNFSTNNVLLLDKLLVLNSITNFSAVSNVNLDKILSLGKALSFDVSTVFTIVRIISYYKILSLIVDNSFTQEQRYDLLESIANLTFNFDDFSYLKGRYDSVDFTVDNVFAPSNIRSVFLELINITESLLQISKDQTLSQEVSFAANSESIFVRLYGLKKELELSTEADLTLSKALVQSVELIEEVLNSYSIENFKALEEILLEVVESSFTPEDDIQEDISSIKEIDFIIKNKSMSSFIKNKSLTFVFK